MSKVTTAKAVDPRRKAGKPRAGKPWTGADVFRLKVLADHQIPAARIARKLGRTEAAVRAEAQKQRIMLAPADPKPRTEAGRRAVSARSAPTNKPPYGGLQISDPKPRAATKRQAVRRTSPPQTESLF